jgi:hypothetical protein
MVQRKEKAIAMRVDVARKKAMIARHSRSLAEGLLR